ncbi:MAG: DNA repair protein RecO [Candidatus Roizmanbacteria bacterium]
MNVFKTEAFVLKKFRLPNNDVIVTCFTQEFGKIRSIAKGVKNITSRRAPHLDSINMIEVIYRKKSESYYLVGTKLISAFSAIKASEYKQKIVYFFFYIIDFMLPEAVQDIEIYQWLRNLLVVLGGDTIYVQTSLHKDLNALMRLLGYIDSDLSYNSLIVLIEETIHEKLPKYIL